MKTKVLTFLLLAGTSLSFVGCAARYPARNYQPRFSPSYSRYDSRTWDRNQRRAYERDYRREMERRNRYPH
jgi:hypothetical protein